MVHYENLEESINGGADYGNGFANSYSRSSYMQDNWAQIVESTMPLKASKLITSSGGFQASVEQSARKISTKIIVVNLISMLVNLGLACVAFYFSFSNDSTSTSAFAADCILDFISGAIVLWRYYGDLNHLYMQAREQIACIYLGALFELSAFAIIIKATSDMISGAEAVDIALKDSASEVSIGA